MKIVLVNKFWYERGGAEKVVLLTKELLEKAGHAVEIFGMNHPDNLFFNKYFIDSIDYDRASAWQKIKYGIKAIYNRQAAQNFEQLLKDFQPDVIHFHNIYHQLSCSIIGVADKMKIKSVMTLHDYKFISPNYNLFHHGQIDESCIGGNYYRCILNNCMESFSESWLAVIEAYFVGYKKYKQLITKFISPSCFLKSKFIQAGYLPSMIEHLPNPLPDSSFKFISDDDGFVLFVGRLSEEKGVKYLIEVAKILSGVNFKIVGDGPDKQKIENLIKEYKLKNVELAGWQSSAVVDGLIKKARLMVVPSVWYENAPLSILESKAHGKVVVASNLGGISELLSEDLLCEPADVLMLAQKVEQWFVCPDEIRQHKAQSLYHEAHTQNSGAQYLARLLTIYSSL